MIDYNQIYSTFIDVARQTVGDQLSTSGAYPSVIRARQTGGSSSGGPIPDYPYISIDLLATSRPAGHLLNSYMVDENTKRYENIKEVLINYTVHGGDSRHIAEDLEFYFSTDQILEKIREETGGQVRITEDITPTPTIKGVSYVDSSSFNLVFAITDTKDVTSTTIDSVEYDGETLYSV